jgi:hypothetical protein
VKFKRKNTLGTHGGRGKSLGDQKFPFDGGIYSAFFCLSFFVLFGKNAEMSNWTLALKWWKKVGKMTLLVISIGKKRVKLRMNDNIIVTNLDYVSCCGL